MTCRVIDCEQRSPAWHAARVGLLTATGAAAMLSRPKKGTEETLGKAELRLRLALESLNGVAIEEDRFENEYMRRGRAREPEAIAAYEVETGELTRPVGFLQHETLPAGCSPDALVGNYEGGLEIKCPKFTTHDQYLKKGTLPSEYVAQVMHSLFVTGLPWWDFCSYCPDFTDDKRLFRVRVERTSLDLDGYALAFQLFWAEVEHVKNELRAPRALEKSDAVHAQAE